MTANFAPIYPRIAKASWVTMTAANTAKDGTGTVGTVFTADATNGSRLDRIKCRPLGTNVASVARFFINNGATNATAGNNSFFTDVSLPAITNSEVAAQTDLEVQLNVALPPGYKINVALGTAVAAGWAFTGVGGDY